MVTDFNIKRFNLKIDYNLEMKLTIKTKLCYKKHCDKNEWSKFIRNCLKATINFGSPLCQHWLLGYADIPGC